MRLGLRLDWVGLGWVGLGWVGLGWVGLGWVGLVWVGEKLLTQTSLAFKNRLSDSKRNMWYFFHSL